MVAPDAKTSRRRWRLKVLLSGAAALVVVGVVGGAIALPSVQKNLSSRVQDRLSAEGVDGISVHFLGQDGTVSCAAPLADPAKAQQIVQGVSGVDAATLDASCTGGGQATGPVGTVALATLPGGAAAAPATSARTTSATASSPAATSPAATAPVTTSPVTTVPRTTQPPVTTTTVPRASVTSVAATAAPTTTAPTTTTTPPTTAAPAASKTTASMLGGKLLLAGTVQSDAQRQLLETAAGTVVDLANVADQLVVDPASGITDDTAASLASLIRVMARNIVNGESGFDGALYINGTYLSTTSQNSVKLAAANVGARTQLRARPSATPSQASQLAAAMTNIVTQSPTMFNKDGTFTSTANATLDQLAALANQYDNLTLSIRGYTDTDTIAARTNQNLSYRYATAVIGALQSKGVSAAMTPFGRGAAASGSSGQAKAQSRRVDVSATAR